MNQSWIQHYALTVATAVFMAASSALIYWGIVPAVSMLKEQLTQKQEALAHTEIDEQSLDNSDMLRTQVERIGRDQQSFERIIEKRSLVTLVKTIEESARDTSVELSMSTQDDGAQTLASAKAKSDATSKEKTEKSLLESVPSDQSVRILMTVTGDYTAVMDFLRKMESLKYLTDIVTMTLESVTPEEALVANVPRADIFASSISSSISKDMSQTEGKSEQTPEVAVTTPKVKASFDVIVYTHE